jgi:hypothetical protein
MSRAPAKTPVPNPAFAGLRAHRPANDQLGLFAMCDPEAPIKIARRVGTRYAAA